MSDPLAALVKGVVALVAADPAVKALCGDPVRIRDMAPRGLAVPHLVIGSGRWSEGAGGYVVELTLTGVSRFEGQEEARALAGAVRLAIDGEVVAADGLSGTAAVRGVEVFGGADRKHAYGVVRIRAVMES